MRRMLYKLLIICLFLILCILLIYFLKKNKQIEKFDLDDERQKKIIIKMGGQTSTDQKIFKYYNNSIEFVRSVEDSEGTVEALFYDESLTISDYSDSSTIDPQLTTKTITNNYNDIIQVINVALDTTSYKTFYLKNDQKVYDEEESAEAILSYTNIIQITPHNVRCFLCLTNSNTLIKITLEPNSVGVYSYRETQVDTTPPGSEEDPILIENTPTRPIISIKGFRRLDCVLYLCMNGDLFYLNTTTTQSMQLQSNVIQFNVPTDSDLSSTTIISDEIRYSCIAIENNIKKVYFNKFNLNDVDLNFNKFNLNDYGFQVKYYANAVNVHSTWITCTTDTTLISYQYYIIYGADDQNKYELINVDSELWHNHAGEDIQIYVNNPSGPTTIMRLNSVFTWIDNKIKSIISYNNELYYLKNGVMRCTPPFFTHTDGVQCVSCGSNGSQISGTNTCKCDDGFNVVDTGTIVTGSSDEYSATTSSSGCYSCLSVSCPPGFYKTNIDVDIHDTTKECDMCQLCTGLPSQNAKIIKNSYTNGRVASSTYTSYNPRSNYYIKEVCTPQSDTIFGQVTWWDDLASGENNYYYSSPYSTGGYKSDATSTSYNIIDDFNTDLYSFNSPYKSIAVPVYDEDTGVINQYAINRNGSDIPLPAVIDTSTLQGLLSVGNDVEFTQCDTCGTFSDNDIIESGGTLCTDGFNLNCDLCSNVHRCFKLDSDVIDIFNTVFDYSTSFPSPSSPSGRTTITGQTKINKIIEDCVETDFENFQSLFLTKHPKCSVET